MKLRFWTTDGVHRAAGDAVTTSNPVDFRPRHCAGSLDGGLCLGHEHPGEPALTNFAGLHEPKAAG